MITCNGIPFTLEIAISYGLPIDNLDHSLEEIIDEAQEDLFEELNYYENKADEYCEACHAASSEIDEQLEELKEVISSLGEDDRIEERSVRMISDELKNISKELGYV